MSADDEDLDPYFRLMDSRGREFADDDDSAGAPDAMITVRCRTTGNFYISAESSEEGSMGDYTLSVRLNANRSHARPASDQLSRGFLTFDPSADVGSATTSMALMTPSSNEIFLVS